MLRPAFVGLCGCLLLVSPSLGEDLGPDSILTWFGCVSLALRNNPELAASRQSLEASKSAYQQSRNGLYPTLTLEQSYGSTNAITNSKLQTRGSVNLNLLNKSESADIRTSKTFISQAEASLRQAGSLLRFNLRKAFAQLLFVQKDIEVSRRIVEMRQEESQLVTLRYNSGRESKGNMLRANAQLLQAKTNLSQSLRNLRTAQQSLNRQMGFEKFTAYRIDTALDQRPPPELPKDEQALIEQRADVLLQEDVVATAEALVDQSKSSYWPDLSIGYSQYLDGVSSLNNGWNILLSYPLFGKGPTNARYGILTAKSNLEKAKLTLRSTREQAVVDLETSWTDYAGAFDQAGVQAALLEAARQRNEEANIRYNSGLLTYDNWEIITSDRISQERQAILAQLNVNNAEAAWEFALGGQLKD